MPRFLRIFLNKFKEYIVLVLLLILSLILITVNDNSKVQNVRVMSLGVFAGISTIISNLGSVFEDSDYIEKLEKRNAELMLENNKLRNFGLENKQLKDLLKFNSVTDYKLIPAKIVSRLVSKISGYIIISKGKEDGLAEGMPVITDEGLVGILLSVTDNYSSVRVFENSLFKVAVKIQRSNVDGIMNWDGKKLLIKDVPTTEDVVVGDRVMVSELSSILPPSIPVGFVVEKESTLSGVITNLVVKPYVDLKTVKNVMIILTEEENQLDSLVSELTGGIQ